MHANSYLIVTFVNMKIRFIVTLLSEFFWNVLNNIGLYRRIRPDPSASLTGQTVIITGCNRGIGKCIAADCVKRGARVIMACRDVISAHEAANEIKGRITGAQVVVYQLDLASFSSIESFASQVTKNERRLDILINNAGLVSGVERKETVDGLEVTMGVNYFGTVLLTMSLLDKLMQSGRKFKSTPRVVFVASSLHDNVRVDLNDLQSGDWKKGSHLYAFDVYAKSKAFLTVFSYQLAKKFLSHGVKVYAVDPGVSATDVNRELPIFQWKSYQWLKDKIFPLFQRSPKESANAVMWAVLKDDQYSPEDCYIYDGHPFSLSKEIMDPIVGGRLWLRTQSILNHPQLETL